MSPAEAEAAKHAAKAKQEENRGSLVTERVLALTVTTQFAGAENRLHVVLDNFGC